MKKTYIAPVVEGVQMDAEEIIATSVTAVGGNSGLKRSFDDAPTEADVKGGFFDEDPWE